MRTFKQVDVFTAQPYLGNPLAVVLDGTGLSEDQMQCFARWTNLSETTFVLPATERGADYALRIFTPGGELPFAGHPTLGSCHAWLEAGGQPRSGEFIVQQCAVGLVRIRRDEARLAFAAPALRREPLAADLRAGIISALGLHESQVLACQRLDNGPVWHGLLLDSPETVLSLAPDHARLVALGAKVGVAAAYPAQDTVPLIARHNREARAFAATARPDAWTPDLEVRGFAAPIGINEDPVTGSLNASLAQWLMADSLMPERYRASQGVCLGRAGQVDLARDSAGQVWVGGTSVTCISGQVQL